jgi:hypothetical protein
MTVPYLSSGYLLLLRAICHGLDHIFARVKLVG